MLPDFPRVEPDACVFLMSLPDEEFSRLLWPAGSPLESCNLNLAPLINISCGEDLSIRELAETVMQVIGLAGKIIFDATKPDGTPRKLLDTSRINQLGWYPRTPLREGIRLSYQDVLTTGALLL